VLQTKSIDGQKRPQWLWWCVRLNFSKCKRQAASWRCCVARASETLVPAVPLEACFQCFCCAPSRRSCLDKLPPAIPDQLGWTPSRVLEATIYQQGGAPTFQWTVRSLMLLCLCHSLGLFGLSKPVSMSLSVCLCLHLCLCQCVAPQSCMTKLWTTVSLNHFSLSALSTGSAAHSSKLNSLSNAYQVMSMRPRAVW